MLLSDEGLQPLLSKKALYQGYKKLNALFSEVVLQILEVLARTLRIFLPLIAVEGLIWQASKQ